MIEEKLQDQEEELQNQLDVDTNDELLTHLNNIIRDCKDKPGMLIPVLQQTQKLFGYLPENAIRRISQELDIPFSEVAGIVGFYSFFSTTPKGKKVIRVCQGTACYVRGGKDVLSAIKNKLKISVGETTKDKEFSLETNRCFGACGLAPVITINDHVIQRVKPSNIGDILKSFEE
jgi:NADH:ubiquinone oxidoreductase subunit E